MSDSNPPNSQLGQLPARITRRRFEQRAFVFVVWGMFLLQLLLTILVFVLEKPHPLGMHTPGDNSYSVFVTVYFGSLLVAFISPLVAVSSAKLSRVSGQEEAGVFAVVTLVLSFLTPVVAWAIVNGFRTYVFPKI